MTNFVGAEYVIATMLMEKSKAGKKFVSMDDLSSYGIHVQRMANDQNINAVFLTSKSQLFNAIYDFSDYFTCNFDSNGDLESITLEHSKDISDLEYRFMGYLPKMIFEILVNAARDIA